MRQSFYKRVSIYIYILKILQLRNLKYRIDDN